MPETGWTVHRNWIGGLLRNRLICHSLSTSSEGWPNLNEEKHAIDKARHVFIRARRPQSNGCVERVQLTLFEECWKPTFARYLIPKYTGLTIDLERYLRLKPKLAEREGIRRQLVSLA